MFGFNMFPHDVARSFNSTYRCYSVSMMPGQERHDVERGGKIIMPPSALDQLTRLNTQYPMLFKLTNKKPIRETHCGVLEFVAEEGRIYLPYWMMRNLLLEEGGLVTLENVSLPVATFAKFQPQSVEFLDITNPKAVLENALRSFACLTTGDIVAIKYNEKIYELCALETKPGKAVSIIECDMNVEFASAVGYEEPEKVPRHRGDQEDETDNVDLSGYTDNRFRAFSGYGNRLDGKKRQGDQPMDSDMQAELKRGIPNYNYKRGTLNFIRSSRTANGAAEGKEGEPSDFEAFSGSGQALRKKPSRK